MLNASPITISIFSTSRSIFRTFVLRSVTKFLFLELSPTGPVSGFCLNLQPPNKCRGCIRFPSRVPQFGDLNFSPALFLLTNVIIFSRKFVSHFSVIWGPWDRPTRWTPIFLQAGRHDDVRSSSSCTWGPVTLKIRRNSFFRKHFFPKMKKTRVLFVSMLVMMHDDPLQMPMSPGGDPSLSCLVVGVRVMRGVHAVHVKHHISVCGLFM